MCRASMKKTHNRSAVTSDDQHVRTTVRVTCGCLKDAARAGVHAQLIVSESPAVRVPSRPYEYPIDPIDVLRLSQADV